MDMPSLTLKVAMYMALCFQWGYKILGLEYISFSLSHSYMSLDQCKETLLLRETLHQWQNVISLPKYNSLELVCHNLISFIFCEGYKVISMVDFSSYSRVFWDYLEGVLAELSKGFKCCK